MSALAAGFARHAAAVRQGRRSAARRRSERVGLLTVEDLLLRFPLRYENRADLHADRAAAARADRDGRRRSAVERPAPTRRPGFRLFELIVKDATGPVRAVFPNQAFLRDVFHPRPAGRAATAPSSFAGRGGLQFTNPEYEIVRGEADDDDETVHTGRIVPIYEKAGS